MSQHLRDYEGNVTHWYLGALEAEAFATNDPELLDRAERGHRLVATSVARARTEDGLPPVGRHDPHADHEVVEDEHGVTVCVTCTNAGRAALQETP